ncbi:MAG: orotidine 5'-phosphate decarboxylase / HUMPS family protein [Candidatus Micrarchaeota archaeon]
MSGLLGGPSNQKLSEPPYLQVALDTTDLHYANKVLNQLPDSPKLIIEVGTPLIKTEGARVANELKKYTKARFVVADMKTMDTGKLEANIAFRGGADAASVSGCANIETIDAFIGECKELGIYSVLDCVMVSEPPKFISGLKAMPDIVNLHRGIDGETNRHHLWGSIMALKKKYPGVLVSVAGGINKETTVEALRWGADIIIVGRYITDSEDPEKTAAELLKLMEK